MTDALRSSTPKPAYKLYDTTPPAPGHACQGPQMCQCHRRQQQATRSPFRARYLGRGVPVLCTAPESAASTSVPACVYPCRVYVARCDSHHPSLLSKVFRESLPRRAQSNLLVPQHSHTAHSPTYWCPIILSAWPAAATTPAPIAIPKLAVRRRSPPVAQCSGAMGRRMRSSFRGG